MADRMIESFEKAIALRLVAWKKLVDGDVEAIVP
jgi:hypothetical protein